MKGCANWQDAISNCALGRTPEADFAVHLATCPQCEKALRQGRAIAGRMEEMLQRSAAVEPPRLGPERVMRLIHEQAKIGGWWRWASVGSAALAVSIMMAIWVRRPAPEADVSALSRWRSPTQALLRPPVTAAWTTMPRLGEEFFKINPTGEIHAQ
jgi:anti-sigma factor RsiW